MEKSRIAALVDGIFAVAMTLLVLDLKLPEGVKLSNDAEVWRQLAELKLGPIDRVRRREVLDWIFNHLDSEHTDEHSYDE